MSFVAVVTNGAAGKEHLAVAVRIAGANRPSRFVPICSKPSSVAGWPPVQVLGSSDQRAVKRLCPDCLHTLDGLMRLADEREEGGGAPVGSEPRQV